MDYRAKMLVLGVICMIITGTCIFAGITLIAQNVTDQPNLPAIIVYFVVTGSLFIISTIVFVFQLCKIVSENGCVCFDPDTEETDQLLLP